MFASVAFAGCTTTISYSEITHERFTLDLPSNLKEQDVTGSDLIKYYSDTDGQTFNEGSVSVYLYQGYYDSEKAFELKYCEDTFELINQAAGGQFAAVEKKEVRFVEADASKPAYCDISYVLKNKDTESFVEQQLQRQYLFIDGADEIVVEAATTKQTLPDFLIKSLDSFKPVLQVQESEV